MLPTALVGVSGQHGIFTRPVLEAMARLNERPVAAHA
jgi:malic enzyme